MSEKYNLQRHEKGQTLAKKPIFKHCLYIKLYEFVYRMRAHAQTQKILQCCVFITPNLLPYVS